MGKKSILWMLVILLILGFFLREYKIIEVFTSNDEMDPVYHTLKTLSIPWSLDKLTNIGTENPIARMFVYPVSLGGINTVFTWVILGHDLLRLPINEDFWFFPFIFMGVLSILLIFLIIKKIANVETAFLASIFMIILPIHIALSRFISQLIVAVFLNALFVLFYFYYFETKKIKYLLLSSFVFSLYIVSHNEFMGILPFILFLPLCYSRGKKEYFENISKSIMDWRFFLLPLITLTLLLIIHLSVVMKTGIVCYDLIGHTFSGGKTQLGFFFFDTVPLIIANVGIVLSILAILSIPLGVSDIINIKKEGSIFMIAISYILPFIILIPSDVTGVWGHISHGLIWLVVYIALILPRAYKLLEKELHLIKCVGFILLCVIILFTLSDTFSYVYKEKLIFDDYLNLKDIMKNGVYKPDSGAKAAGYWIRTYTPSESMVFSDATGGGGIEPPIGEYYFNRKIIGKNDAKLNDSLKIFEENEEKIGILVVRPENEVLFLNHTKFKFYKVLELLDENKPVLFIYSKNKSELEVKNIKEYNSLFDKKYYKLKDFTNREFVKEEQEKIPYFIDKCSKNPISDFYKKIGLIK